MPGTTKQAKQSVQPNILFILVDQVRMPPPQSNLTPEIALLNQVLSFDPEMKPDNPFLKFFPAFARLRKNAVRLAHHQIASAACVPSRAALFTGQYPVRTGVSQTAGMFKQDVDPGFPWLPNNQVPTVGDWFRAGGYTTHFFGRHDFTTPPAPSLEEWGFSDWSGSWPSSQGGGAGNLGVFRDIGFADQANVWLNRQALGFAANVRSVYNNTNATTKQAPWFAVASFVNPHDITGWPLPWLGGVQAFPNLPSSVTDDDIFKQIGEALRNPATIPQKDELSNPPIGGTYRVNLNPDGFPQGNGILPPNWDEDLSTKPDCQYEASFKISQGFLSLAPKSVQPAIPLPYKSTANPHAWLTAHLQIYIYFQYLVNLEIDKVLSTMETNGLLDNTIVTFTSDHGEVGGAHGGQIEKWHNAYREALHVPFVVSSPLINPDRDCMRNLALISSHIDMIPTLLGLAGFDPKTQTQMEKFILGHDVYPLVGRDLSPYIRQDKKRPPEPQGVLFITDDEITLPTDTSNLPTAFIGFLQIVEDAIAAGKQNTTEGPIVQPNRIQAVVETEWKLAKYWDPYGLKPHQWELYYLKGDPEENINLVSWKDGKPVPEPKRMPRRWGLSAAQLRAQLARLQLALEQRLAHAGYASDSTAPVVTPTRSATIGGHDYNLP